MTCTTSWYSDIVYSDHVVGVRELGKHLSCFEYKLYTWRPIEIFLKTTV